ncbi:hypothetical protein PGT21_005384 [Puccinia graminis f. sp. tritici]|uniref:Uncharacterized protein n=1 Tax=Puccinia graminis f. sp. tritici TaxID=56615 RepID=A0A5B0NFM5_PUCGR|nr:hypothetical protein PGT21_005384 [Puccinia graminis f. sp. tritici]
MSWAGLSVRYRTFALNQRLYLFPCFNQVELHLGRSVAQTNRRGALPHRSNGNHLDYTHLSSAFLSSEPHAVLGGIPVLPLQLEDWSHLPNLKLDPIEEHIVEQPNTHVHCNWWTPQGRLTLLSTS